MVWRALDGIDDLMLAGTWDNSSRTVSIQKNCANYETFYNINLIFHKYLFEKNIEPRKSTQNKQKQILTNNKKV